jgi:hypothetical protein
MEPGALQRDTLRTGLELALFVVLLLAVILVPALLEGLTG